MLKRIIVILVVAYFLATSISTFAQDNKYEIDDNIDMIIITKEEFKQSFEEFIIFKAKFGYQVEIETIEQISIDYYGVDLAEKIRNYIIDMYNSENIEYVLLGGDYTVIPTKHMKPHTESPEVVSDQYYSNLDAGFDNNGNGILCEIDDNVDNIPNVYIGRFPAHTLEDMETIIDKTMNYYKKNGVAGFDGYFRRVLFIGFNLASPGDGERLCERIRDNLPNTLNGNVFYEETTSYFRLSIFRLLFDNPSNVIYSISHGALNKIGIPNEWGVYSDDIYNSEYVSGLYFISSCYPGDFSRSSFSSNAMIAKFGGCVNYIGSSGEENPTYTKNFHRAFFDDLFTGSNTIGKTLTESRINSIGFLHSNSPFRYAYFSYNLMGDPTNYIIRRTAMEFSPSLSSDIQQGTGIINGTLNETPTYPVTITLLSSNNNKLLAKTVTSTTDFTLNYENLTSDSVIISLSSAGSYLQEFSYPTTIIEPVVLGVDRIKLADKRNENKIVENGERFSINFDLTTISNDLKADNISIYIDSLNTNDFNIKSDSVEIIIPSIGSSRNFSIFDITYNSSIFEEKTVSFDVIFEVEGNVILTKSIDILVSNPKLELSFLNFSRNEVSPVLKNVYRGSVDYADIRLIPVPQIIELPNPPIYMNNIKGKTVLLDSITFTSLDLRKNYKLGILTNNMPEYFSETFSYNDTPDNIDINLHISDYIGKYNLSWEVTPEIKTDYKYNVYLYYNNTSTTPKLLNLDPLTYNSYEFEDNFVGVKYVQISVIDESDKNEFAFSKHYNIGYIKQYKDSPYQISPYITYNSIILNNNDNKIVSISDETSISGIDYNGNLLGDFGFIYSSSGDYQVGVNRQGFAIGDIDNNGTNDIVSFSRKTSLTIDSTVVRVTDLSTGNILAEKNIYGYLFDLSPVLVNSDTDDELEIIVSTFNGNISGDPKGAFVYMLDYDNGKLNIVDNFPIATNYGHYYIHSPSLVDLNNDGTKEIIFDNADRIQIYNSETLELLTSDSLNENISGSISLCDIDNDNIFEFTTITRSKNGVIGELSLQSYNNGIISPKTNWVTPVPLDMNPVNFAEFPPPAVFADIDNNGDMEIIVITGEKLYIFNHDKTNYGVFPLALENDNIKNNISSPSLADFDGDDYLDILFIDSKNEVWCYSGNNGSILPGFPVKVADMNRVHHGTIHIKDLDSDGDLEFSVADDGGKIHIFDYPLRTSNREILDKFRGDLYNSGIYDNNYGLFKSLSNNNDNAYLDKEFKIIAQYPNPFNPKTNIRFNLPISGEVNLKIYNIKGEIIFNKNHSYETFGTKTISWSADNFSTGMYVYKLQFNKNDKILSGKLNLIK